ncbi:helix-turn-helix domain-containing protein [Pseudarthrobacter sp. NIBRBAC000502770]|uniref:helix-turn-helix domain-containing protein n=1 Tax=Pseudarthrobacter sp. NIBRBAC000502770 TaxID=2590785 RepID=UPI00114078DE|nr:helix-turn-helix domain-containing protein [Pseudarthrobacter sp. NIBRBAC000502770]QDG87112.1 helix-turn-helix transcriptional regulator [Pseudarthrobacter sp. NIBRBAC000502770]
MPRIYKPLPGQPQEAARALSVFNANTLRAAVIRDLAQHLDGDTTGNIAKRIGVDYRQVYAHIKTLEAEGLVSAAGEVGVRSGQRIHYSIDLGRLRECGLVYMSYLSGE